MPKPLTKIAMQSFASELQALLEQVNHGEMTATAATRHRLEGAIVALKIALGESDRSDWI
jgi:hypothetical protein